MASSGQLSLGTTAGTDRSIGAAVSGYTNTSNISLKDVSNNATAGSDPADGAPFEMTEFYNYAEFIPFTKTAVAKESSSGDAVTMYGYRNYNGTGAVLTSVRLYQATSYYSQSGTNLWTQTWYAISSVGTNRHIQTNNTQTSMTTNSLYTLCSIVFTDANKPNSYRVGFSSTLTTSASGPINDSVTTGSGSATYNMNPPNTDYTFTNGTGNPSDFKINHNSTAECFTGSATADISISIIYKKTGYADTTAVSYTFDSEHDYVHTGQCP